MGLLTLLLLHLSVGFAQDSYAFEAASQTYNNLKAPIVLNDSGYPDFYDEFMLEVDFPIYYFGKKVFSVLVKNDGQVVFGNSDERIELFPVRLKLKEDSQISYTIEGEQHCSNRILKIEYRNMGFQCDVANYYFTNAQLWLYESTGVIEIHYGPSFDNPGIYDNDHCHGDFYYGCRLRFHSYLSVMPYGDPNHPNCFQGNLSDLNSKGIGAIPSPGVFYRFDPEIFMDNNFKISPNPARYYTNISRPQTCGDFQINIFGNQGQLLFQKDFTAPAQHIDTANFPPGIYFIQIWDKENQQSIVEKLMVL